MPKAGWLRPSGSNQYAGCKTLTVCIRREVAGPHPNWYAHVCYEVPADQVRPPAADGALGLDRNAGQATDSDGVVYAMPDMHRLDVQIARKQRELRWHLVAAGTSWCAVHGTRPYPSPPTGSRVGADASSPDPPDAGLKTETSTLNFVWPMARGMA